MINYSNKDCFGSEVSNLNGVKFDAYHYNNNSIFFNTGNVYAKLSDDSTYLNSRNIKKITWWQDLNDTSSAYRSLFCNIFPYDGTYGSMLQTEGTDQLILYAHGKYYRWKDDALKYKGYLSYYELWWDDASSMYWLSVNGRKLAHYGSASSSQQTTRVYFGTRYINGIGYSFRGRVADFKCYDANDNLVLHFPCNEGSGTTIKDTVTNESYSIVNQTESTLWQYCTEANDKIYLDPTMGQTNIAEFNLVENAKKMHLNFNAQYKSTDPNLGADIGGGWDFTSKVTTKTVRGNYVAGTNILYLKNHDPNDLPAGCSYGIDLKTQYHLGYYHSYYFLGLNQVNPNLIHKEYWNKWRDNLKVHVKFWYKKHPLSTTSNAQITFGFGYFYLNPMIGTRFANDWTLYDKIVNVSMIGIPPSNVGNDSSMFAISAHGADEANCPYIASIAGLEVELLDAFDVAKPVYATYNKETGNIKHAIIYNKNQINIDDLKRMENKFTYEY